MKATNMEAGREIWFLGVLAGAAGGFAEILWVIFYGAITGNDMTIVARSIAAVASVALPFSSVTNSPVASGIAIHMLAAIALGVALALTWRALLLRNLVVGNEYRLLPAALAIIWVFNFFVLLPLISAHFDGAQRHFTEVLPYPVSLFSKLLFGLAAAAVLKRTTRAQSILIRT